MRAVSAHRRRGDDPAGSGGHGGRSGGRVVPLVRRVQGQAQQPVKIASLQRGDWVYAPLPLFVNTSARFTLFKIDLVRGEVVYTQHGYRFIEIPIAKLAGCTFTRDGKRHIFKP